MKQARKIRRLEKRSWRGSGRRPAVLLVSVLLIGCLAGCGDRAAQMKIPELLEPVSVSMDTAVVRRGEIYRIDLFDAEAVPAVESVAVQRGGTLGELPVRVGDRVEKGEVIARLADGQIRGELAGIRSELADCEEQYRLENELAGCDVDLAKLAYEECRAAGADSRESELAGLEVERAELLLAQQRERQELAVRHLREQEESLLSQIGECDVTAPVSGEILWVTEAGEGGLIAEGGIVAVIASPESGIGIRTEFIADGMLKDYDECRILHGGNLFPVIPREYDRNAYIASLLGSGSFYSYFDPEEVREELKCGDYVQLQIIRNRKEEALVLPLDCLLRDTDGYYVYRMEEDGIRVKTPVAIGVKNEISAEITEGLEEGDEVYVRN